MFIVILLWFSSGSYLAKAKPIPPTTSICNQAVEKLEGKTFAEALLITKAMSWHPQISTDLKGAKLQITFANQFIIVWWRQPGEDDRVELTCPKSGSFAASWHKLQSVPTSSILNL